ncbi:MAG: protease inhibitor I42 family protein [Anaerolineae bacterium]
MRKSLILVLLVLLGAIPLGAATAMDVSQAGHFSGPIPSAPLDEVVVTEANEGATVTLEQGQALAVILESNPSTGYQWDVAQVEPPVLRPLGDPVFRQRSPHLGAPAESRSGGGDMRNAPLDVGTKTGYDIGGGG